MRIGKFFLAALGVIVLGVGVARAQEADELTALRARVAELEQAVNNIQSSGPHRFASDAHTVNNAAAAGGDCCADGCGDCCEKTWLGPDFYNNRCRGCGWIGGAEVVYLRPYFSEDTLTTANGGDIGFQESWRLWFGRQFEDGLGARIRYWEFDHADSTPIAPGAAATTVGAEFRTLDLEATQAVDFRKWTFLVAGGTRYAETDVLLGTTHFGFDGMGLTGAIEASRDLNSCGSLRFLTQMRLSALYGNGKISSANGVVNRDRDDLVSTLELKIGPQYRREWRGVIVTVDGTAEAQYWNNGTGVDTQDFGFFGFGGSIGIAR